MNIAPTETPFMSNAGTGSASQTNHEWQTDGLASAAANKQIEGDDAANLATVATTRLGNYEQISTKVIGVSGTDQAVTNAGRGDELAYQMAKAGKELKRDMEFTLVGQDNFKKSQKFFKDLNIKNLEIYFDNPDTLARKLSLRGVPTTILFNKEGKEFARIIGSIDFNSTKFTDWLSSYN